MTPLKKRLQGPLAPLALTLLSAALVAIGMHVFIFPTDFAPSGVDGLATVLQAVTGINAGIFTLLINLPLLTAAWFLLNRRYVLLTLLYTFFYSCFLILLEGVDFYRYAAEGERLLPVLFGGISHGMTGIMLRIGASSGGVDVMAGMIQRKMPYREVERIISLLDLGVVAISYPVFRNLNSVLLTVIEIAVCEWVTGAILRTTRTAVRCELYGNVPKSLLEELEDLPHLEVLSFSTPTVLILPRRSLPQLTRTVARYPDVRYDYLEVAGVSRGES